VVALVLRGYAALGAGAAEAARGGRAWITHPPCKWCCGGAGVLAMHEGLLRGFQWQRGTHWRA